MSGTAHSTDESMGLAQPFDGGDSGATSSWFNFWSRPEGIHISDRHLQARYRAVATEFLAAFPDCRGRSLIDWGCGHALESQRLADAGLDLLLYDRSVFFQDSVRDRFGGKPGITVLDDAGLAARAAGSVDYILVCSVIQYLTPAELDGLMATAHRLLKPAGTLILADIIPKQLDTLADTVDFLAYSARHRFFFSGLRTLFDMIATDYRNLLQKSQLVRYDLDELSDALRRNGYLPKRAGSNIGISRARKTLFAVKPASAA